MGGAYTVVGDRLTTGDMFMTEMACAEPLMTQDQWLAAFLADVGISLDGDTLILDDGTTKMTLLDKEVATPDQPIEGTLWVVDGIVTGDAVSSVPQGVDASLRIVDGQAEVQFGCNSGGGPVEVTEDTLTFGPMMSTKMACEAGPAAVESCGQHRAVRHRRLLDRCGRADPDQRRQRPDAPGGPGRRLT